MVIFKRRRSRGREMGGAWARSRLRLCAPERFQLELLARASPRSPAFDHLARQGCAVVL